MNMTKNVIITIGRQFGSGGHEIGNRLAKRLDIPLYDRNLVKMAAEELKITDKAAMAVDESGLNKFLAYYSKAPISYESFYHVQQSSLGEPLNEQLHRAQTEIIKKLAGRSSCVMVGRCADYVLREEPGLINVFIVANKSDRKKRISEKYELSERKAADQMKKIDRERRYYYELHTGRDWGCAESHQMVLNVSMLGMERAVDVLAALFEAKKKELER